MSEARPKLYLLDVEGTVAPLSLTSEVLFPYARTHFEAFLRQSIAELEQKGDAVEPRDIGEGTLLWDLAMLRRENRDERDPEAPQILPDSVAELGSTGDGGSLSMSPGMGIPRILAYIYWLMDRDRKSTALKSLQGKIWKAGFESGELKGTLFDDVPDALRRWSAEARVAIYSSGSVDAQKLFFRYSSAGDLTPLISAYFDTRTGPKMERASYAAIAAAMDVGPQEVLFFSDSVRELDAARAARCETELVVRAGNAPVEDRRGHHAVESFAGL
ncbi:MAG TPA: acireductone synthase [Terracidiphilus sp.]|jgi:2,3-diketo-5-methylthio-1-phosphopentane phosphatase